MDGACGVWAAGAGLASKPPMLEGGCGCPGGVNPLEEGGGKEEGWKPVAGGRVVLLGSIGTVLG
jgi:hypothetical protein